MSDILNNLQASFTGNIPKAILCIRRLSKGVTQSDSTNFYNSVAEQAKESSKAIIANASASLASSIDGITAETGSLADFKDIQNLFDSEFHIMQVQYNPTSLSFYTQAGAFQTGQGAGESGMNQITQMHLPPQTSLSCDLIFDAVNPYDAFMNEKLVNSIGGLAEVITDWTRGEYSVQVPVDGLVSLVTQEATRQVVFHWSKMTFYGELESVNAKYTMFNPKGFPVRAVVTVSIRQKLSGLANERDPPDIDYWNKAFTNLFGEAGVSTLVESKSNLDKFSNLVNLNI